MTRAELLAAAEKVKGQLADLGKRYEALAALLEPGMTKDDLLAVLPPAGQYGEMWNGNFAMGRYPVEGGYSVEYQGMGLKDAKGTIEVVLTAVPRILSPEDAKALLPGITTAGGRAGVSTSREAGTLPATAPAAGTTGAVR